MVPGFADALNPFQQAFSEAQDFIDTLRQANPEFASFYDPISSELAGLEQVADSWIQLSLQSFAPALAGFGDPQSTTIGQDSLTSSVAAPSTQDLFGTFGSGETPSAPVPLAPFGNPIPSGGGPSTGSGGLPGGDSPYGQLLNPIPSGGDLSPWVGTSYGMILPASSPT